MTYQERNYKNVKKYLNAENSIHAHIAYQNDNFRCLAGYQFYNITMLDFHLIDILVAACNFNQSKLISADFNNVEFVSSYFIGASLINAHFGCSTLVSCDFTDACLVGAEIGCCRFIYANLSGANFTEAKLTYTDFVFSWYYKDNPPVGLPKDIFDTLIAVEGVGWQV